MDAGYPRSPCTVQHNNMQYKKCQQSASCPLVCDGVAIFFAEDVVEYRMSRETSYARKRHLAAKEHGTDVLSMAGGDGPLSDP